MSKKSLFYVILSGLITAGAVLGWSAECEKTDVNTHPAEVQAIEAEETAAPQAMPEPVKQANSDEAESLNELFIKTITADDATMSNAIAQAATDARLREAMMPKSVETIRLTTPEMAPQIGVQPKQTKANPADIMAVLNTNEALKSAKNLAVVDVKKIDVIAANDDVRAFDLMAMLPFDGSKSGKILHLHDQMLEKMLFQCIDDDCNHAVIGSFAAGSGESSLCKKADIYVSCGEQSATQATLVKDCAETDVRQAVIEALKTQSEGKGTVEVEGKPYRYVKSTLNGCAVAVAAAQTPQAAPEKIAQNAPKTAPTEKPVQTSATVTEDNSGCKFTPVAIAKATAAGIVMILLGLVCIRRKEEKIVETKDEKSDTKQLTEARDAAVREKAELDKKVAKLETEATEAEERTRQLNEQLEYARSAYKKEQLQCMSLQEENRRLEDALTAAKQEHTNVANPSSFTRNASNSAIPVTMESSKKTQEVQNVDPNRVTSQAQLGGTEQSQAFFSALTDEGWDEIEDSFDAIFSPSKAGLPGLATLTENAATTDDTNKSDENEGLEALFAGLDDDDKRVDSNTDATGKHITTETSLKPVLDSKQNQIPTLKPKNTSNAGTLPSLNRPQGEKARAKGMTMNGLSSIKKPAEKSVTESASEMAIRRNGDVSDSFKPSPSWTGKKVVQDKGMDENSLMSALKRRAKDVSQMGESAKNTAKQSGALSYNRGISRSGVFSVTGSRVDIDPNSDFEYFKSLYEKYVQVQKECGEATDKFTMEQFVSRLSREKAELMKKYKCSNVYFTVTAKNGKASLKASPKA